MLRIFIRQFRTSVSALNSGSNSIIVKELLDNSATFKDLNNETLENDWSTLPYPEGTRFKRDQSRKAVRDKTDPKDTSIILFPGQGSQHVGMNKNLMKFPGARDIFMLANEILKYDLLKLCLEGPRDKLDQTMYSQPAIMVSSLAALERLKEERPNAIDNCVATAGFSLGDITALVFAGALPFDRAVRLVQIRGEAMQLACNEISSGMATVLYGPDTNMGDVCTKAINWCISKETNAKSLKLRRVKRISVSGAFHTELMAPAVEPFAKALKKIQIEDPIISVHSNVDGKQYRNAGHILHQLPNQIVRPVKWEQTMHILYERSQGEHFPRTFECGPGKGLTTLLKQVNAKAWDTAFNIET